MNNVANHNPTGKPVLTARPTMYRGIPMRSRLEALWAEYFDRHGTSWRYEPMCFAGHGGQYLPDFVLAYDSPPPLYLEIKPPPSLSYRTQICALMSVIWESDPTACLAVVFGSPDHATIFGARKGMESWRELAIA